MFLGKFGYSFPNPVYEENQYGRGEWAIRTRHAALHFVLSQYFGLPIGRKKLTSTISKRVTGSRNPEVKFAALAGMFSSDGYINSNRRDGRFGVNVCLVTTVSSRKANETARLIRQLGLHCFVTVSKFRNPFTHRQTTAYAVIVNRRAEVVGLFFRLFPYLAKPSRTRRWMELLSDADFYRRVIFRSPRAHLILRKAAIKAAGNSYRYLHVLVKLADVHGIHVRRWSGAKHWTTGKSAVPLPVLVDCCNILEEDVLNHVPTDFAALLWLHRVLSFERLLSLRTANPLLNLKELAGNVHKGPAER
jgi:signal recognition particle subunit SEC65